MRAAPLLLLLLASPALGFSAAERRAIESHGPWPPAFVADPSNRASGNKDAVELGCGFGATCTVVVRNGS